LRERCARRGMLPLLVAVLAAIPPLAFDSCNASALVALRFTSPRFASALGCSTPHCPTAACVHSGPRARERRKRPKEGQGHAPRDRGSRGVLTCPPATAATSSLFCFFLPNAAKKTHALQNNLEQEKLEKCYTDGLKCNVSYPFGSCVCCPLCPVCLDVLTWRLLLGRCSAALGPLCRGGGEKRWEGEDGTRSQTGRRASLDEDLARGRSGWVGSAVLIRVLCLLWRVLLCRAAQRRGELRLVCNGVECSRLSATQFSPP
jgi:hypothetical protein